MLKINLLPSHIHTRKQVRVAIVVVTLLVAAEAAFLVWMRQKPVADAAAAAERTAATNTGFQTLSGLQSKAQAVQAEEAGFQPKFAFITDMLKYNRAYPNLYERTARYTYREVTLTSLSATPNSLAFNAYASSPAAVSLLMIGLSNNPDLTFPPTITGVPGWSAQEQAERAARVRAAQQQSDYQQLPGSMVIGGPGGYPGYGGDAGAIAGGTKMDNLPGAFSGGMGGNGPGGPAMGPGMGGYPGMAGMGGGGNGPGGPAMMPGMGGYPGMAGMGGGGGNGPGGPAMGGMPGMGGGGGGGGGDIVQILGIGNSKKPPLGFMVSVAAGLTQPISRPTYGSAGTQGGGGGFGGGGYMMPGMGGGGMMGGNGPGGPGASGMMGASNVPM